MTIDIAFTEARVHAIAGRAARQWPASPTSAAADEPPDLAALYRASDGVELADGTSILRRDEIAAATAWLVGERALSWGLRADTASSFRAHAVRGRPIVRARVTPTRASAAPRRRGGTYAHPRAIAS